MLTDKTGTVVWEADYRHFGEALDNPNSQVVNNLRFPGQYYDAETGFHYNYHRYYEPKTGRYLQPDPIGFTGGINRYLYVKNNPINAFDIWGLTEAWGAVIGYIPDLDWKYDKTKFGGTIAFEEFSTVIHDPSGRHLRDKKTEIAITFPLVIGGGGQVVFIPDEPAWEECPFGNSSLNLGLGTYFGFSCTPKTSQISVNMGLGWPPVPSITIPVDQVDTTDNLYQEISF